MLLHLPQREKNNKSGKGIRQNRDRNFRGKGGKDNNGEFIGFKKSKYNLLFSKRQQL